MKVYKSEKEFLADLQEVPKNWHDYKKGERYYITKIDIFFKSKREAREFYRCYKKNQEMEG